MTTTLVVLHGDQTGEELLSETLRLADPSLLHCAFELKEYDCSLAQRRATANGVVRDAADAIREYRLGLKAATITPEKADDVGSPNALLRERIGAQVIVRTGRPIPGISSLGSVATPITVVRMAVDDAYNAKEWREEQDGNIVAYRTEHISRTTCMAVAQTAFHYASSCDGIVFGGPKYTVSPIYEGLLKEMLDAAHETWPHVRYEPQLIDATYALLLRQHGAPLVIPALNRDGDCLSDLVLALFGSLAGAESLILRYGPSHEKPEVVVAEAPHGTAPTLEGKNIANPMAMILALASILQYADDPKAVDAAGRIRAAVNGVLHNGIRTADLGGTATTSGFVDAVLDALMETSPTLS